MTGATETAVLPRLEAQAQWVCTTEHCRNTWAVFPDREPGKRPMPLHRSELPWKCPKCDGGNIWLGEAMQET